jgi:signal transduction histidine kinase
VNAQSRSSTGHGRSRYYANILVRFVLAIASFVGASAFANSRLERVARQTRSVSESAMPSLALLGTVQSELAEVHLSLEEAADGRGGAELVSLHTNLLELEQARRQYEALPPMPGALEVWARVQPMLDRVFGLASEIEADVRSGAFHKARASVAEAWAPTDAVADAALAELRRITLEQGDLLAQRAEWSRVRARNVSFLLDGACAIFTAALAWIAVQSGKRFTEVESRRADELDAFAARVAHDLRGPLQPALFALQGLTRELGPDHPRKCMADRGVRSLKRADLLIHDLLTYARAGAAPEVGAHASVRAVVAGVVEQTEREASCAKVEVDTEDLPSYEVGCPPGVLSSVVGNLVGNAIKYMPTDAKERRVRVRAFEAGNRVRVEVSDTGRGLPRDTQEHIFEPYVRADQSRPGLGLGLATVKRLIEGYAGRVGVQSSAGRGSVFWFELPRYASRPG